MASILLILFFLVGCREKSPVGSANMTWKIAIITGTSIQNEEGFSAAFNVQERYGEEHVVLANYPDDFSKKKEEIIQLVYDLSQDPEIKAIIACQGVPGIAEGMLLAKKSRPDVLFIIGTPDEDPVLASQAADIVLSADELSVGEAMVMQAKKMGAKVFVHYSFERHLGYQFISQRKELLARTCEREEIVFVDAISPDPLGPIGIVGARQYILEDVPEKVARYGVDTAFFSTNCALQFPLIEAVMETGAIYPQPCCPSPFHGFPMALGIKPPPEKKYDSDYMINEIQKHMKAKGMTGRLSTWAVPVNRMFIIGGAEYAREYAIGEMTKVFNEEKMIQKLMSYAHTQVTINKLELDGEIYDNFYMIMMDYVNL